MAPVPRRRLRSILRSRETLLFFVVFGLYAATILPLAGSNEKSHLALTISILTRHSFDITGYGPFAGIDVSIEPGHLFSALAPGLSVLLLAPYYVGSLLGASLNGLLPGFFQAGYVTAAEELAVQVFSVACSALSAVFVYKMCLSLGSRRSSASLTALVYAFATLAWVYGKTSFSHTYSALFLVLGYYFVMRQHRVALRDSALAGIFYAVAASLEYTNLPLILPGVAYLWAKHPRDWRELIPSILPSFASMGLLLAYNYVCLGNPLSFPESFWLGYPSAAPSLLGLFSTPPLVGFANLLFSPVHGIFVVSPIVILSVPAFYLLFRRKKAEALALSSVFVLNLLIYSMWNDYGGGATFGPRYLVPSIPFLVIPLFAFFERVSMPTLTRRMKVALMTLLAASSTIASLGAITSPLGYPALAFVSALAGHPVAASAAAGASIQDLGFLPFSAAMSFLRLPELAVEFSFWALMVALVCLAFALSLRELDHENRET